MTNKYSAIALLPVVLVANVHSAVDLGELSISTASRFDEPVATVLAPTSVLTREEIEKLGVNSLVDALKTLPGIEIGQNGGRGQLASIFMRGTESNHTLVLIDGVRLPTTNISSSVDFNMLPLNIIERIEVIRGSGATVYGSDAIGGVINIITRGDENSRRVSFAAGSMNTYSANFGVTQALNEKLTLQAMGGYENTDGYNVRPISAPVDEEHGFEGKNLSLRLGFNPNQSWQANLHGRWYQNEVKYDSFGTTKFGWTDNKSFGGDLAYQTSNWQHLLRLEYTEQKKYDYAENENRNYETLDTDINQFFSNYSSRWQALNSLAFIAGADLSLEKYLGGSIDINVIEDNPRRNIGIYALANWQLHDNWLLEASARYDNNQQYGDYTTGQIAFGWDVSTYLRAFASAGTAFKIPTYIDLYGFGGNTDLKPEESVNYEVGLEGFYENFDWSINAYQNDIDNLIQHTGYLGADFTNGHNINIEKAQIRGIELGSGLNLGIFRTQASIEFRDPRDESNNQQLARRGEKLIKWQNSVVWDKWTLAALFSYQSERPNLSATINGGIILPSDILPSYSVWDFTAQYAVSENLKIRGKIANAFDKKYALAKDYPAAERAYYLNIDLRF